MYSSEFFYLELLREKFENALEISGNLVAETYGHPGLRFSKMSKFFRPDIYGLLFKRGKLLGVHSTGLAKGLPMMTREHDGDKFQ